MSSRDSGAAADDTRTLRAALAPSKVVEDVEPMVLEQALNIEPKLSHQILSNTDLSKGLQIKTVHSETLSFKLPKKVVTLALTADNERIVILGERTLYVLNMYNQVQEKDLFPSHIRWVELRTGSNICAMIGRSRGCENKRHVGPAETATTLSLANRAQILLYDFHMARSRELPHRFNDCPFEELCISKADVIVAAYSKYIVLHDMYVYPQCRIP